MASSVASQQISVADPQAHSEALDYASSLFPDFNELWFKLTDELKMMCVQEQDIKVGKAIYAIRREMKTPEVYNEKTLRGPMLLKVVEILGAKMGIYEEDYTSGTHDEMAALDDEIQRLGDLTEATRAWATVYILIYSS